MYIARTRMAGRAVNARGSQLEGWCRGAKMNLTWLDASILTVLFGVGTVIVQSLSRRRELEAKEKQRVACRRHDWVRLESRGLVCQRCGKIPG
jgi:hypothetical protein